MLTGCLPGDIPKHIDGAFVFVLAKKEAQPVEVVNQARNKIENEGATTKIKTTSKWGQEQEIELEEEETYNVT